MGSIKYQANISNYVIPNFYIVQFQIINFIISKIKYKISYLCNCPTPTDMKDESTTFSRLQFYNDYILGYESSRIFFLGSQFPKANSIHRFFGLELKSSQQ